MAPTRKSIIGIVLLSACGLGIVYLLGLSHTKPNILVIMVDDLGFNDLAINNDNTEIDTPNMDQLAREGVRFTRHYAAVVCSPARAAFLTGMHPERVGFHPNGLGISPEIVTLPERLKEEGYTTWHIGKWHIGDLERTAWPDYQGFDHWFGFLNQWRLAGKHVNGELKLVFPRYENPWLQGDSELGRHFSGHLENILTDKAVEVITDLQASQTPWFLNLWFYAPHAPEQPAAEFARLYPDTATGRFRALVNQLDTNIGRILLHLDAIGALENTIIVVVSDNGGTKKELDSNAPFAGYKPWAEEGTLRTPLIIRWPDKSINGQVYSDTIGIEDIYPTLLAAIGVDSPEDLDGDSFYNSISRREPAHKRDRFWESAKDNYGALSADGRWRLYQPYTVYGHRFEPKLYDLEQDPSAAHPVEPAPPVQVTKMTDSYKTWYKDVHTVKTDFAPDGRGGGVLSGMDFLRTPGLGEYTIGIGLPSDLDGQIVAQAGIWNMSRTSDSLVAQFGSLVLSANLENVGSCHSVVISGFFRRQFAGAIGPDRMSLALYIDGLEVDSKVVEETLMVADPTIETIIGNPEKVDTPGKLSPPVILNARLDAFTPWTLDSFSRELCNNI